MYIVLHFISDSQDNLEHMAVDSLVDHTEAVLDTGQAGIQDRQAAAVHSQAAEDSLGTGIHQLAEEAANSCKGCNPSAMVEQQDMACCSEPLDMVLLALYFTHTDTHINEQIWNSIIRQ